MNKNNIGTNAGIIWRLMDTKQYWTYAELIQNSGLSIQDLFSAIGWLSREDKIDFSVNSSNEEVLSLSMNLYF